MNSANPPRSVLVTGASSGIGLACALHLDGLGFRVLATVRRQEDADHLRAVASHSLVPLMMDVTDASSIAAARRQVADQVGDAGLYGLLNNAGVAFMAPMECVPMAELRRLFDVNFFGALAVIQEFLPLLRMAQGRIANVSSTASIFVVAFHGPYSAAKCALNGVSDALRLELNPLGVHVATIVSGNVNTPMFGRGLALTSRLEESLPPKASGLYRAAFHAARSFVMRGEQTGISPEAAARQMCRVFTDSRPRIRYYVGPDACFYGFADRLVSGRLRDWLVRRSAGLL